MFPLTFRMDPGGTRPKFALGMTLAPFQVIALVAFGILLPCSLASAALEANSPLPPPHVVESDESLQMDAIKSEVAALLNKRDYTGVEALADRYRSDPKRFASGTSALMVFYRTFERKVAEFSDEDWEKMISGLEEWKLAKPDSPTPRLALATAWKSYAWNARGNGVSSTVTPEGYQLFFDRLGKANAELEEAKPAHSKCPDYYFVAQGIGPGQEWEREAYDELCNEGEKLFPDNYALYMYKCYFLLPKWYGKEGEWEAYLDASADKFPGEDGDLFYARVVGNLDGMTGNIMRAPTVSWPRAKKGFEVMLKRYPTSLNGLSSYASVACKAEDWPLAKKLFGQIGDRVTLTIWKTEERFLKARVEAFSH